ncbi:MAG: hypothetical protein GYB65_06255 [Chloroflexi bacterium]|nr:hypothetical protein [Chloroflexota bacterium]
MNLPAPYITTTIGSFPHPSADGLCEQLLAQLDIPAWPQLPRRTFYENMYAQYASALPAVHFDAANEKLHICVDDNVLAAIEAFYTHYIADDLDYFALKQDHAAGFYAMLEVMAHAPGSWIKGQVTGPVSFGLTVTDQNGRATLYHDELADVLTKNTAMHARWQIAQLQVARPNVLLFIDEPYMAAFGSAYVSLEREAVVAMLTEIIDAVHAAGALAGVHCCANTDWSVLLATPVDLLSLDAYGYLDTLALYPAELRAFLDRGGWIAWGIVPNTDAITEETPLRLADRLRQGLHEIADRAQRREVDIGVEELGTRSLLTPSCGLGPTDPVYVQPILESLVQTSEILQTAQPSI